MTVSFMEAEAEGALEAVLDSPQSPQVPGDLVALAAEAEADPEVWVLQELLTGVEEVVGEAVVRETVRPAVQVSSSSACASTPLVPGRGPQHRHHQDQRRPDRLRSQRRSGLSS
jgi:hypothetical protein